jgi:hypothetical protein
MTSGQVPPDQITLCAELPFGVHCLGRVHNGKCGKCSATGGEIVVYELAGAPHDAKPPVSTCAHVAVVMLNGGTAIAACGSCRGAPALGGNGVHT